ncbi:MAG: acyl-CoA reductase [Rikenellaceae bacterium]
MIDIFVELGSKIEQGVPREVAERAYDANKWFSVSDIEFAARTICEMMLKRERLTEWFEGYQEQYFTKTERVLIIMAGNIPFVAFFDLLCIVIAGDEAIVKLSHKDRILMEWIIEELRLIEPSIPILIYKKGEIVDRVIATGSDAAIQHFAEIYHNTPTLLRGSRHSIAIIGEDGVCDGLVEDIYRYSGLGCRNVSMIFIPKGYDLRQLPIPEPEDLNPKYRNNYLQNRALITISRAEFFDNGASCLIYQDEFPARPSTISIVEYSTLEELTQWIATHDNQLQCIVANDTTLNHPRRVNFGEAQRPSLYDYADGVDTMKFLIQQDI